jgi:Spy/CpxP family protein refolding chaperone
MKSILSRLLIAACTVALGTALAQSQATSDAPATTAPPAHRFHRFGMAGDMHGYFRQLDLTDQQKTQMKAIMQKEGPAMKPLFQQLHQSETQLRQFAEGTYDDAKVRGAAAQQAQIQAELTVQRTKIHNELYQILTPEQQTKLKELEASRAARIQAHTPQAPQATPQDQE